jgi:pyrimidine-nucleoside phosphorylase
MNQPLGNAVGNALEVREALDTLHGGGPEDFREHCLTVASHMLVLGGIAPTEAEARLLAESAIRDGSGFARFRELVIAQGGDVSYVDHPEKLPSAPLVETVPAPQSGYLRQIHAREIGEAMAAMGGGRERKDEPIDHAVGVVVHHKVGDHIKAGEPLFTLHARDAQTLAEARERILSAHGWSDTPVEPLPLFYGVVR